MTMETAGRAPEWNAWGAAGDRPTLTGEARRFLRGAVGEGVPQAAVPITDVRPAPSRLSGPAHDALVRATSPDRVLLDEDARLRRAGGQSYVDLVSRRAGENSAPDAVVLAHSSDEVLAVLRACSEHGVAVVPFGGGTSVVGGVAPERGSHSAVIALDLALMNALLDVDPVSLTATVQAGMPTPALEAALARHGLMLGHAPQSWQRATVGGYVVTRSAGQASTGVGRFDDLVLGLTMATPVGLMELAPMPGSAAGPDLRRLVMGSEGVLGVVTEVVLRVRRLPESRRFEAWMAPSFEAGQSVFRQLTQQGTTADVMRLSDQDETAVALELNGPHGRSRALLDRYLRARLKSATPCLVVLGFEGHGEDVEHRRRVVTRALREAGAVPLGRRAGAAWERGRFHGPHLRDTLLDAGYLVETLETATLWSSISELHERVTAALRDALADQGTPALVGCHISHVYGAGASLYFTVIARRLPGQERQQWKRAKQSAGDAIRAGGGTATHHHGVGSMHLPWAEADLTRLGTEALVAVKSALDPAGILNPGKLLSPRGQAG